MMDVISFIVAGLSIWIGADFLVRYPRAPSVERIGTFILLLTPITVFADPRFRQMAIYVAVPICLVLGIHALIWSRRRPPNDPRRPNH